MMDSKTIINPLAKNTLLCGHMFLSVNSINFRPPSLSGLGEVLGEYLSATMLSFFPALFSFWYGKVSQCFNMKNHVYMPDDFGLGHMKHYVAINTTS